MTNTKKISPKSPDRDWISKNESDHQDIFTKLEKNESDHRDIFVKLEKNEADHQDIFIKLEKNESDHQKIYTRIEQLDSKNEKEHQSINNTLDLIARTVATHEKRFDAIDKRLLRNEIKMDQMYENISHDMQQMENRLLSAMDNILKILNKHEEENIFLSKSQTRLTLRVDQHDIEIAGIKETVGLK